MWTINLIEALVSGMCALSDAKVPHKRFNELPILLFAQNAMVYSGEAFSNRTYDTAMLALGGDGPWRPITF